MSTDEVNVLFIEDDPTVAQMYKLKLELDGYQVNMAKDGEEGLKLAQELKPDIIFLDIRLPKMDGFAVLEGLRSSDDTRRSEAVRRQRGGTERPRREGADGKVGQ